MKDRRNEEVVEGKHFFSLVSNFDDSRFCRYALKGLERPKKHTLRQSLGNYKTAWLSGRLRRRSEHTERLRAWV
jgi:hypothetical protein